MARICDLSGKKPVAGNSVSFSHAKTKRRFLPNLKKRKFYVPELDRTISVKVSTKALKSINKIGIYAYLKKLERKGIETNIKL